MRRDTFALLIAFSILLITSGSLFATGGDMGGPSQDGSADHPYLIQDFNDFQVFCDDPNYWDNYTRLETDIDLISKTYTTAPIAPDTDNTTTTFVGTLFTGIFDGNDHVISNLTIDTAGANNHHLGLFGQMDGSNAKIKNLGLENINITGGDSSSYLGGLCGRSYNLGTITNCYAIGSIAAGEHSYDTGGLCGSNAGTITDCYTSGAVTGGNYSQNLGGLCGISLVRILNCHSSSNIDGNSNLGGLCGSNRSSKVPSISNCYATGYVTGNSYLGGFCGKNDITMGEIANCYCVGEVSSDSSSTYLGGFCGYTPQNSKITNCFWNLETAGDGWADVNNFGALGKTTLEMQTQSTFTDAGWEFDTYLNNKRGWYMPENSYPKLCWQNENLVKVPDIESMTLAQTQAELITAGFTIGNIYQVKSWQTPAGSVAGISASIGGFTDKTIPINIFISAGSSGNGSFENPYQIACQADLDAVNNDLYSSYAMTRDIYLNINIPYTSAVIAADTNSFQGSFDGNDFTIYNLYIQNPNNYIGLFGQIQNQNSIIKNLSIEGCNIVKDGYGSSDYVGMLCGYIRYGKIENCSASGVINLDGGEKIAGICGEIRDAIINKCNCNCNIMIRQNSEYVGGLCGRTLSTLINNCHSQGNLNLSSSSFNGGLVGNGDRIINCSSSVDIYISNSSGGYAGGLAGTAGTVKNSFATGNVSGRDYVGGLVGKSYSRISDCYSTGNVSGRIVVGQLIGEISFDGKVENSFSLGQAKESGSLTGLVGFSGGETIINSFWDVNTSGFGNPGDNIDGAIGKTTAQMQNISTFIDAGWDIVDCNASGKINKWHVPSGDYPVLYWQGNTFKVPQITGFTLSQVQTSLQSASFGIGQVFYIDSLTVAQDKAVDLSIAQNSFYLNPVNPVDIYISTGVTGSGDENNPYKISNKDDLDAVNDDLDANYILLKDIYLDEYIYLHSIIANNSPFTGTFDGDGHKIFNQTIYNLKDYYENTGLFKKTDHGCKITNLGIENCYIDSSGEYVGSLAGYNRYGIITNCYCSGILNLSYNDSSGGMIGYNYSGNIKNCYSKTDIINNYSRGPVGGFIGENARGNVENCYCTGKIINEDEDYLGGFIGDGYVGNCFWDVISSGIGASGDDNNGAIGKITLEMQTQSTFTNAGWDFVGESINGSDDIWRMCVDGVEYPKLWWEFTEGDFVCGDGVDLGDFAALAETWNLSAGETGYNEKCDLSGDDMIGFADLAIFTDHWLDGI